MPTLPSTGPVGSGRSVSMGQPEGDLVMVSSISLDEVESLGSAGEIVYY